MAIKHLSIHEQNYTFKIIKNAGGYKINVINNTEYKHYNIQNVHYNNVAGLLYFEIDGRQYKAHISKQADNPNESVVTLAHTQKPITVTEHTDIKNTLNSQEPAIITPAKRIKDNNLKSPLAGRITRILVTQGQLICRGQPILCIESMKMENEISASRTAYIKTIFIAEGNVVQPNQILVEFEEEGDGNATTQNAHERASIQDR